MGYYTRETWEIYPWFDRKTHIEKPKNYSDFEITRQLEVVQTIENNRRILKSYELMHKTGK